MSTQAINIESRLEPFIDEHLVDRLEDLSLILHKPTPREIAVVHDEPWEGNVSLYHTVFADKDRFKMYYRGAHYDSETRQVTNEVACYAESSDGINWSKPTLGRVTHRGSGQNNIIWNGIGSHNFTPFKDKNPDCRVEEQYKALASGKGGLYAFRSTDGIDWSLISEDPVITEGAFDSQNLAFWDVTRRHYVDFHRQYNQEAEVRDIMTSTSVDFHHWTDPVFLKYPDIEPEHLYTNQITPYHRAPHIFIGLPKRFIPTRSAWDHQYDGVSDAVFMTSRDGVNFKRWGEAIIRPGLQKERWVNRNNGAAWGILETGSSTPGTPNELSIYSAEGYYQGTASRMRRFTWRIDGFTSIHAKLRGSQLLTKPLIFTGKSLTLNFSTSAAGYIRVEVQHENGSPVEGLSLEDSDELYGDSIEQVVMWKGESPDLSCLAGPPIRLRVLMSDADLFSIRFQ